MFRSFHLFYPFLGESLPTIFENGLVIHKDKESFLVVPLLALKMKKDLSEIAGWVGPTKKDMGLVGHLTWNAKHSFRSCIKVHGTPTLSRRNQRKLQATTSKTSILDANGRFLGTN